MARWSCMSGSFFIIGDSVRSIQQGKFTIAGVRHECDADGWLTKQPDVSKLSDVWNADFKYAHGIPADTSINYYPRGMVIVNHGVAEIRVPSAVNTPKVIENIKATYCLEKMKVVVVNSDELHKFRGSMFALK